MPLLNANVGGLSEATVRAAYEACYKHEVSTGIIGLVSILAIVFMISKILSEYQKMRGDAKTDRKVYFEMIKLYAKYAVFIAAFPFLIRGVETVFAEVQDSLTQSYNTSLEAAGTTAITKLVESYIIETMTPQGDSLSEVIVDGVDQMINPMRKISLWLDMLGIQTYMVAIYILKYIYFFFCCGRYLWLIMLQVLAPVAIVLALNKNTIHYTTSWGKNLLICYLLIPFFLIADSFSEAIISVVINSMDFSKYGLFAMFGLVIVKISMFAYVSKKAYNLL